MTDVFAALVEPRAYKAAMSSADALARMRRLAGKLDPACLDALERVAGEGALEGEIQTGPGEPGAE